MLTIRTAKNKYRFINVNTDKLKIRAFNVAAVALALYGFVTLITK